MLSLVPAFFLVVAVDLGPALCDSGQECDRWDTPHKPVAYAAIATWFAALVFGWFGRAVAWFLLLCTFVLVLIWFGMTEV